MHVCMRWNRAPYQYTQREVADLTQYLSQSAGKHVLGTYATFYHQEGNPAQPHVYDNRQLARLFGFDPSKTYTTKKLPAQPKFYATVC